MKGVPNEAERTIRRRGPVVQARHIAGVFTLSILTILSIILFLRVGYVVGIPVTAVAIAGEQIDLTADPRTRRKREP